MVLDDLFCQVYEAFSLEWLDLLVVLFDVIVSGVASAGYGTYSPG